MESFIEKKKHKKNYSKVDEKSLKVLPRICKRKQLKRSSKSPQNNLKGKHIKRTSEK
jgi:hypothetical protein